MRLLAVGFWLFIASSLVVTDTVMAVGYYLITINGRAQGKLITKN